MVQPLWKTVWWSLKKLNIELPYDLAMPCLGICMCAKPPQSCPTLCDPMKCSQPGAVDSSSVHGDSPGKNTGVGCHAFGHLGIYQREMYI